MTEEDFKQAMDFVEKVREEFTEDYVNLINKIVENKEKTRSLNIINHCNTLLLNEQLNNRSLYSDAELNYISVVKKELVNKYELIRNDKDPSVKTRMTPEQILRYSSVNSQRPPVSEPPMDRNLKEGKQPIKPKGIL
jgi:hypothetical protein